jgi:hypothetical protein
MKPNPAHALDGGIPVLFDTARAWPAASDVHRSAAQMNQRVSMRIPRALFLPVLLVTCLSPLGRLSEVRGETNSVPTVFTNAVLKEYRERTSGGFEPE